MKLKEVLQQADLLDMMYDHLQSLGFKATRGSIWVKVGIPESTFSAHVYPNEVNGVWLVAIYRNGSKVWEKDKLTFEQAVDELLPFLPQPVKEVLETDELLSMLRDALDAAGFKVREKETRGKKCLVVNSPSSTKNVRLQAWQHGSISALAFSGQGHKLDKGISGGFDDVMAYLKQHGMAPLAEAALPKLSGGGRYGMLNALKNYLEANVSGLRYIEINASDRVWTRGDRLRYKDLPSLAFKTATELDKVKQFLKSKPHQNIVIRGPHGSDQRDFIKIGNVAFGFGLVSLIVADLNSLKKSAVYHIFTPNEEQESLFVDILSDALAEGNLYVRVTKLGGIKVEGKVVAMENGFIYTKDEDYRLPPNASEVMQLKQEDGKTVLVRK